MCVECKFKFKNRQSFLRHGHRVHGISFQQLFPKKINFFDRTRQFLDERWKAVRGGGIPQLTDMRHLFYAIRLTYLTEKPDLSKIDSESKTLYSTWESAIKLWCVDHAEDFGFNGSEWWRVREALNIWAAGRALCEGEGGSYLVDSETRDKVATGCSFILLCEKKTISKELTEALRGEGYHLNIVSTGGFSAADVQEAIVTISESLDSEEPTFYFLSLHDYDLAGVGILRNLKERYDGVIDIGVNGEFLGFLKERGQFDSRLMEEQCENHKFLGALRDWIADGEGHDYTPEDFDYLQGEQVGKGRKWVGKRIELDSIHVVNGIRPFVDYVLHKIQSECKVWDLSRIGVEPFKLESVGYPYHEAVEDFTDRVSATFDEAGEQVDEPLDEIRDLVEETLNGYSASDELDTLEAEVLDGVHVRAEALKGAYKNYDHDHTEDHEDELKEVNSQITRYRGDVRHGAEDLASQVGELQKEAQDDALGDPQLEEFDRALREVDTGDAELRQFEVPDKAAVIRDLIETLKRELGDLN